MNLFNEHDVFIQELPEGFFDMDKEIFSIGREIKKRLGDDGYLLDNYLSIIFTGIEDNALQDAFYDSEDAFSGVYELCRIIREGKDASDEDVRKQQFYPEVKEYLGRYSEEYRSSYTVGIMTRISIMPIVMKKLYAEGKTRYSSMGRMDTVRLQELHEKICLYTGEKLLERLNELVKTRFIVTPALNAYIQAVTDMYLCSLLGRTCGCF